MSVLPPLLFEARVRCHVKLGRVRVLEVGAAGKHARAK